MAEIQLIRLAKRYQPTQRRKLRDRLPFKFFHHTFTAAGETDSVEQGAERGFEMERLYLTVPDGMTMVILGPNGCGKTTLLRIIAGLTEPDEGEVRFDGRSMQGVPTQDRRIGMVFQSYALYPHFTSGENILSYFIFKARTPELDQLARRKFERTSELLGVDIEYLLDRRPDQLSAGEQQRVALGRCITRDPAVLLLDEPFVNLDSKLRARYRVSLKHLLAEYGVTSVYVTHDQQEARILADRVAIMSLGHIEQVGSYRELYQQPTNLFVAEFLNLEADTPALNLLSPGSVPGDLAGYKLGIRPEDLSLADGSATLQLRAEIERVVWDPLTNSGVATALVRGSRVVFKNEQRGLVTGDQVHLGVGRVHLFDPASGRRARTIVPSN